jgi:hypothetical protein
MTQPEKHEVNSPVQQVSACVLVDATKPKGTASASGHARRFRDVLDESGLASTPERLRQRREPTLRANAQSRCAPARCAGA